MKEIAYCLYGQPRNLIEGYKNISHFINQYPDFKFDFFYHTWFDESKNNEIFYDASPWRIIPKSSLVINKNIISKINNLYKPKSFSFDKPIKFNLSIYFNSVCFSNTDNHKLSNINNVYSQFFSRTKVRNTLFDYIKKFNKKYDFVITSRFDFLRTISINLYDINPLKFYCSDFLKPKLIFPDNFFILNTKTYLDLFNIIPNISKIINNHDLSSKLKSFNITLEFSPEIFIFSLYIYLFNNIDNVIYSNNIPNFI